MSATEVKCKCTTTTTTGESKPDGSTKECTCQEDTKGQIEFTSNCAFHHDWFEFFQGLLESRKLTTGDRYAFLVHIGMGTALADFLALQESYIKGTIDECTGLSSLKKGLLLNTILSSRPTAVQPVFTNPLKRLKLVEGEKTPKRAKPASRPVDPVDFSISFLDVDVSKAGLESNVSKRYLRSCVKSLLAILDQKRKIHVEGPPGSGKSSTVWMWACSKSASKSVRWIHFSRKNTPVVLDLAQQTIVEVQIFAPITVESLVSECECDVLILDGITRDDTAIQKVAGTWYRGSSDRILVRVASLQLKFKLEDIHYDKDADLFFLPSWTLDEYRAALHEPSFRMLVEANLGEGDDLEEKLLNKYFLAGGSARWMFDFPPSEVIRQLDRAIVKFADFGLITKGLQGHLSDSTVNSLFLALGDATSSSYFIISEYVARCLSKKCEGTFLREALKSTLIHNPSFDGWILEADFLHQVRFSFYHKSPLNLLSYDRGHNVDWRTASQLIEFQLETELTTASLSENTWIIPKRWNQGCYDAVQIRANSVVRFVQVTRADSPDLKLKYAAMLLEQLPTAFKTQITKIDIIFVIPSDKDPGEVKIPKTTGSLNTPGNQFSDKWWEESVDEDGNTVRQHIVVCWGLDRTK